MAISPSLFLSELTFHRSLVVKVVVKDKTSSFQFFGKRHKTLGTNSSENFNRSLSKYSML